MGPLLAGSRGGGRRWLLLGVVVLLAARAALPAVLRRVVASRASEALRARVGVGNVDLALWRARVALEDVTVRPADAGEPPGELPAENMIAWKRLAVELRWLPLLHRTVQLRAVELDGPRVVLDRLASGDLNLARLVPAPATDTAPAPPAAAATTTLPAVPHAEAAPATGWRVGVDRFLLRGGWLRFRDFTRESVEPVEVSIDKVEVRDIALAPGLYGEPSRMMLLAEVDRGSLRVDGRLALRPDGFAVDADVKAKRLPLHRSRVYVPRVGWSDLRGQLAAALAVRFESGGRNQVSGTIILDDTAVRVPALDEPALAWRRVLVRFHPLDLVARCAAVAAVDLHGAALVVDRLGGFLLPILVTAARTAADTSPEPVPVPDAAAAGEARPWRWSVASLRIADSRVHVLAPQGPLDVGVALTARGVGGDDGPPATVTLALTAGDGTLAFDGTLGVARPGLEGALRIDRLSLPELVVAAGVLPPQLLRGGRLATDLHIAVGSAAPPADLRVRGTIGIAEPWLAAADQHEFSVGARTVQVAVDEVHVPGVLAPSGTPAGPIEVRLARVDLDASHVQLTRTEAGLALPAFRPAGESPPPAPPPTPAVASPAPAGPRIAIGTVHLSGGRAYVTDRTVTPFYTGALDPLEVDVEGLRWPELALGKLRVTATSDEQGKIEITGSVAPEGGRLVVDTRKVALPRFNPYATRFSPYSISRGDLSLSAEASFGGGRYDATSELTLHDFDLGTRGGDGLFQEQFGIPLSLALALLRDADGDIDLEIPLEVDAQGTRVGILSVIGGALRRALLNALASPLKLAGMAFGEGREQSLAPAPIAFRPGRDQLAPGVEDPVAGVAALLASRPGIGVTLTAAATASDARWLRAQGLRDELARGQGFFGAIAGLPERGRRDRIRTALDARARDEEGSLDAEDTATLERWLDERPPPPAERLHALAAARMASVEALLRERHGLGPERVTRREPGAEPGEEPPSVRLELGAVGAR